MTRPSHVSTAQHLTPPGGYTPVERFLRLFAAVEQREATTALILIANIFLILTAYYLIKPVREGWLAVSVLQGFTKIEVKAYSAFGQSMLLIAILPVYAALASRWTRRQLLTRIGVAFGLVLVLFWAMQPGGYLEGVPYAGVGFYLFVGIFSVTLVAQFWSFASDLYGAERGKRLFPLVALGASSGAVAGSWIGEGLLGVGGMDAYDLILLSLVPLAAAIAFARWSDARGTTGTEELSERANEPAAPDGEGPYRLIAGNRYLVATALVTMLFSWVVASGDNVLFAFVQEHLEETYGSVTNPEEQRAAINAATTAFYGNLFFWINLVGLLLQAFLVSRILRFAGFGALLLATPLVSLVAYSSMLFTPVLALVKVMKIVENASNYSVNNTARHILWLPATKEMLYQAKPTIDTLFVRFGDGLAALTVLIGSRVLDFEVTDYLAVNVLLIVLWIAVGGYLVRNHRRWSMANANTHEDSA